MLADKSGCVPKFAYKIFVFRYLLAGIHRIESCAIRSEILDQFLDLLFVPLDVFLLFLDMTRIEQYFLLDVIPYDDCFEKFKNLVFADEEYFFRLFFAVAERFHHFNQDQRMT